MDELDDYVQYVQVYMPIYYKINTVNTRFIFIVTVTVHDDMYLYL